MTHILNGVVPVDFARWSKTTITLNGRVVCTARRSGVTIQLVRDEQGWWHVTKWHGGQRLVSKTVKRLPSHIARCVETARRQYARSTSRSGRGAPREPGDDVRPGCLAAGADPAVDQG